jgi:thiol-disulfide isomerase/thioredoxin
MTAQVAAVLRVAAGCLLALAASVACAADLKLWSGPTPALALKTLGDEPHRLEDYRGRVVLLNFWATWCTPCREEMPSIGQLRKKLAGRPFSVLAVNVDEPDSRVRKFLAEVPLEFPVVLDPGGRTTRAWKVRILPASFIIGPDGRIRYAVVGELDWGSERVVRLITELLPANKPSAVSAQP